MNKENIESIIEKWKNIDLSIKESGDVEVSNMGYTQSLIKEDYANIQFPTYKKLISLRKHSLEKYGAGNHMNIPVVDNIQRAIRHIHTTVGTKSEESNTMSDELVHVIFRLMMASDNIIEHLCYTENKTNYSDWVDTERLYKLSNNIPNILLFPSTLRRILGILNMDGELLKVYTLVSSEPEINENQLYCILDTVIYILHGILSEDPYTTKSLNNLLILSSIILACINKFIVLGL